MRIYTKITSKYMHNVKFKNNNSKYSLVPTNTQLLNAKKILNLSFRTLDIKMDQLLPPFFSISFNHNVSKNIG